MKYFMSSLVAAALVATPTFANTELLECVADNGLGGGDYSRITLKQHESGRTYDLTLEHRGPMKMTPSRRGSTPPPASKVLTAATDIFCTFGMALLQVECEHTGKKVTLRSRSGVEPTTKKGIVTFTVASDEIEKMDEKTLAGYGLSNKQGRSAQISFNNPPVKKGFIRNGCVQE